MARIFAWGDPVKHKRTGVVYKVLDYGRNLDSSFKDNDSIYVKRLVGKGPNVRGRATLVKVKNIEDAVINGYRR